MLRCNVPFLFLRPFPGSGVLMLRLSVKEWKGLFVPEDEPSQDEIEAIEAANKDIAENGTIPMKPLTGIDGQSTRRKRCNNEVIGSRML